MVVLPNIRSGILAACLLAFITSLNDVPVTIFLTGPGVTTLPIQMLSYVEYYFEIKVDDEIEDVVRALAPDTEEVALPVNNFGEPCED